MPHPKLNGLSDERAAEALADAEALLPDLLARPRPADPLKASGLLEDIADAAFGIAALRWRRDRDPAAIRDALRVAGERDVEWREHHARAGFPLSNHWTLLHRSIGLVVGWCDASWRARLGAIPPLYASDALRRLQQYERAVLARLRNDATYPALLVDVQRALAGKVSQEDEESVRPGVDALAAIEGGDAAGVDDALARMLAKHERLALKGSYRTMHEGLICLQAVFTAVLAREKGLAVTATSRHLLLPG